MTIGTARSTCDLCALNRGRDALLDGYPTGTCDAFPEGIPLDIWVDGYDHRQPYDGDGGVVFVAQAGVTDGLVDHHLAQGS